MTDLFSWRPVRVALLGSLALSWAAFVGAQGAWPNDRAASGAPSARPLDYIVAVVNAEPITNQDVRARAQRLSPRLGAGVSATELARHYCIVRLRR